MKAFKEQQRHRERVGEGGRREVDMGGDERKGCVCAYVQIR